ncbi:hypothetical protein [Mesorhizobium sp.]|uniref:hypothetical protein n=1 Tax=Mesorhizobium sp. TaxID=1871066 RepID=UPI00257C31D3|nr:hypothetical protein [Mesorhizobium sp.]
MTAEITSGDTLMLLPRIQRTLMPRANIDARGHLGISAMFHGNSTFYYRKDRPTARQRQLYRFAYDEFLTNMKLIRPGVSMKDLQASAWPAREDFESSLQLRDSRHGDVR